jgi:hypothetical protein
MPSFFGLEGTASGIILESAWCLDVFEISDSRKRPEWSVCRA